MEKVLGTIIIEVSGGVVQCVSSDLENIKVEILDHDNGDCGEESSLKDYKEDCDRLQPLIDSMYTIY